MKFLFYVHSYITYLISLKIIEEERLNPANCILLIRRDFKIQHNYPRIKYCFFPKDLQAIEYLPTHKKFWISWGNMSVLDQFLMQITDSQDFLFFVPHTRLRFINFVLTSKKCKGFSYIEEGLGTYQTFEYMNLIKGGHIKSSFKDVVVHYLNFKGRVAPLSPFYNKEYTKAYGANEASFPGFSRKYNLKFNFSNSKSLPCFSHVFVFDALVEAKLLKLSTLLIVVSDFINSLIMRNIKYLYIKYHPAQEQEVINEFNKIFDTFVGRIQIKKIQQDVSIEEIAGSPNNKNTEFYTIISSGAFYASLAGRKAFTLAPLIVMKEPEFKNLVLDTLPPIFNEKVQEFFGILRS